MAQKQKHLRVFYTTWAAVAHFAALFTQTVRYRLPRLPAAECVTFTKSWRLLPFCCMHLNNTLEPPRGICRRSQVKQMNKYAAALS